ncbi:MAG: CBS domain-containing protein [Myxococcales bacterium]|nr:CBS domain-containing protein [Myxococcales bacterium]HIK83513.1 CBS domain-containing protein [Myxococcales bacterium]
MNQDIWHGDDGSLDGQVVSYMYSSPQSAFIVCDEGVSVGVISERGVVTILERTLAGDSFDGLCAGDIKATPVHTLAESECMGEVIQVMKALGFRRVPIVDGKDSLAGIVNLTDLQRAMNRALEGRGRDLETAVTARTAAPWPQNSANSALSVSSIEAGTR